MNAELQGAADRACRDLGDDFLAKLWAKDPSPWSADPEHATIVRNALGWVAVPELLRAHADELRSLAASWRADFDHVVVLGMGGSSLAPDVERATFGAVAGYPRLHVLDSSDPAQVKALDDALDIGRSLFVVASKSGTTTEPEAFFRYFYERVKSTAGDDAGAHFIAISDPGTKLVDEARAHRFRRVFENPPDIGGRYSALSYFGMVPAALAGYDVAGVLDRALDAMREHGKDSAAGSTPGVRFGAALGALAKRGRDKLTIVCHPSISAFGAWAEQLIAESTGKQGVGIVPVEGEALGPPGVYGTDRVFVSVGEGLPNASVEQQAQLSALEAAGHPVLRLPMRELVDIGAQYYVWEVATAAAGAVLGIDAFDQPNVQESKDNTKRLLTEYARSGAFAEPAADVDDAAARVIALAGTKGRDLGASLRSALAAVLEQVVAGDYVALNAYIPMTDEHRRALDGVRLQIRDAKRVATTVGFGPRFLHSTGQLHKGGPPNGVFLQLTADPALHVPIPGMVDFGTLERAQALGDFQSLDNRKGRGARIHCTGAVDDGLRALSTAVREALASAVPSTSTGKART